MAVSERDQDSAAGSDGPRQKRGVHTAETAGMAEKERRSSRQWLHM